MIHVHEKLDRVLRELDAIRTILDGLMQPLVVVEPVRKASARRPYSIRAVSRVTGLSRKRIDKAIALGEIKSISFGGNVLVPPAEVDRIKGQIDVG